MRATEVLIIGAGPFGLSVSTHLRGRGVDHIIVGRPMDTWSAHMQAGMYLKSEPFGSDMSCPQGGYDLEGYCRAKHIDGIGRGIPLPLAQFLDYSDWYIKQLVPDISEVTATEVKAVGSGFQVSFAETQSIAARNVVVATGVLPYFYIPDELAGLPAELLSHTADHQQFEQFKGRRVAIVGSGSSGLESAALLHEAGAEVTLIARTDPVWGTRAVPLNGLNKLRDNKLCEGWKCPFWDSPAGFRLLPRDMRVTKARTVLGPLGAWWLKDRVVGVVDIVNQTRVRSAGPSGGGVKLMLNGPTRSSIEVDHVIAATGFHMDIARLSLLPAELQARIDSYKGYPVLNRAGESTVPGLYFTGAPAAFALGPSMRFIAGTHNLSGHLTQSVVRRAKDSKGGPVSDQALQAA